MKTGLYDHVLTEELKREVANLADARIARIAPLDPDDAHAAIAQFLEHALAGCMAAYRGRDAADQQRRLVDRIIAVLSDEFCGDEAAQLAISTPLQRLLAVHRTSDAQHSARPDTPLARSALLTGTRVDPSLGSQLRAEVATCDRLDILCSFIKWSGLRVLLDDLRLLAERSSEHGPRIRVITTSYMGATDPRAIDELISLPNTEVQVSYDTKRTRLHAKAYVFHRETGFGSAYIGSANISNAALSEGLEWTTKISHYELPYLWTKIAGTFETYWADDEFQRYSPDEADRLRAAVNRERSMASGEELPFLFDLRPYPFQEEILEALAAEREIQSKHKHLVVAATGTGKTMVAAFDYRNVRRQRDSAPSLLFVAHREEILRQALSAFRGVLRDQNFGDLLVGGREPDQTEHLFCSIQTYNSRELWRRGADAYQYVVVDEFHHAAAPSYRRLLDHVDPEILLGLTATPERTDQLDIAHWFGGRFSAEVRLPDAINRKLLSPFQYFGVADCVDLEGVTWQRGGYRVEDLDRLYTGNDVRAQLVFDKVREIHVDALSARGLGFCVSVAHAEFMARFFTDHGIPAAALTGESPAEERITTQSNLRARAVNFVFVVDLYNEGVDIPEVDTVLFLRPTESLTIFLQQFGRGLRLHDEKECLTVIDFIGAHRREYRFASRLRALSSRPELPIDDEIERGFPHLPAGCVLQFERVARQRVLQNIRQAVGLLRPRMVQDIRELGRYIGRAPSLTEAIEFLDTTVEGIFKRGLWSRLLGDAGLRSLAPTPDEDRLARGLLRICHIDDELRIRGLRNHLDGELNVSRLTKDEQLELAMLHVTLWNDVSQDWSLEEANRRLRMNPAVIQDLREILDHRLLDARLHPHGRLSSLSGPLAVHGLYTRDEALVGLGKWSMSHRPSFREGVLHLPESNVDAFFVTLQKTEDEYSPTTMYEDYLISPELFHWQSQSTTSSDSPTGQRYTRHGEMGYTPLLFVRETRRSTSGLAAPYYYLGPCSYVSHEGSRPISIIWKLRFPIPSRLTRGMMRQAVG